MLMYLCVCEKAYRFRDMNAMHVVRYVSAIFFLLFIFFNHFLIYHKQPNKTYQKPLSNPLTEGFELCCITLSKDAVIHRNSPE